MRFTFNKVLFLMFLFNISFFIFAEDLSDSNQENNEGINKVVPGFIFSSQNILLDLESYQGGIGVKFLFPDFALRASIGGLYENTNSKVNIDGSLLVEFPFFTGVVTPYWGGGLFFNYSSEKSESDEDWTRESVVAGGIGALLGAEMLINKYISFFIDYEIRADASFVTSAQSVGGDVTETKTTNYQIASQLGNSTSLGFIIYFKSVFGRTALLTKQ